MQWCRCTFTFQTLPLTAIAGKAGSNTDVEHQISRSSRLWLFSLCCPEQPNTVRWRRLTDRRGCETFSENMKGVLSSWVELKLIQPGVTSSKHIHQLSSRTYIFKVISNTLIRCDQQLCNLSHEGEINQEFKCWLLAGNVRRCVWEQRKPWLIWWQRRWGFCTWYNQQILPLVICPCLLQDWKKRPNW